MPTADAPQEHLREQVEFLRAHTEAFDAGKEHFAKPTAHVLRTLLHQTARSQALLVTLGARDDMPWFDSAGEVDTRNPLARITIAALEVTTIMAEGEDGQPTPTELNARYFAPLEPNQGVLPPVRAQVADLLRLGRKPWRPGEWLGFADWWDHEVIAVDDEGTNFYRKDLVLAMAHKEGGSHIDTDMGAAYRKLTRANGLGYYYGTVGFGKDLSAEPDPVPAAIRQIAYEVDTTISRQFPVLAPGGNWLRRGPGHAQGSASVRMPKAAHGTRLGRE